MIIGIGIDCCDVRRMEKTLTDGRFLKRFFSSDEQAYILDRKASAAQSLAGHFAAKEAGLKALGCGIAHPLTEIEVKHDQLGAPFYRLTGGVRERMLILGGEKLHLSITHLEGMAAAVAILEGSGLEGGICMCPNGKQKEGLPCAEKHDAEKACVNYMLEENEKRAKKEALLHQITAGKPYTIITETDIHTILPERPFDAHKSSCGHALIVAGSLGMAGAAALCVEAALRGGAGLVTAACPMEIIPIVQTVVPCAMCIPIENLRAALATKNAIAAGPGLGNSKELTQTLQTLLQANLPQVWDADALNWLSNHFQRLTEKFVLTPHYGEAARLLNISVQDITDNPAEAVFSLHARYGAVALLKGPVTLITDGQTFAANTAGTPGMASGGSGDVLTGLIAAFLAQGISPFDAARAAAFLHGKAGEIAAARFGVRSMTAKDIINALRIE